jgi:hypothetical protein
MAPQILQAFGLIYEKINPSIDVTGFWQFDLS